VVNLLLPGPRSVGPLRWYEEIKNKEKILKKVDHFLDRFFRPRSVAIVGATNNHHKINYGLVGNLVNLNFQGAIYPVNPRGEKIQGIRTFARLKDIPDKIDLVVIAVPATKALDIVEECDTIGVKALVIINYRGIFRGR
jgi:acyl-CoA synthetase (NDP forming)